jgi:hypothetical protein
MPKSPGLVPLKGGEVQFGDERIDLAYFTDEASLSIASRTSRSSPTTTW